MSEDFQNTVFKLVPQYLDSAQEAFDKRMSAWDVDVFEKAPNEVLGGLLARQMSLATTTARSPSAWNLHLLPLVLRSMADVYITFCWIAADPRPRSRTFIEYGLGQEKLAIEKYREAVTEGGALDEETENIIRLREAQLNAERASFLLPVNLGSWSEMNLRNMAIEVGEKQFYDLVFTQFSAGVHSTWQHIWRMNLLPCRNPLHMGHRKPFDPQLPIDAHTFTHSAKYLCKTFARFDKDVLGGKSPADPYECYDLLWDGFAAYFNRQADEPEVSDAAKATEAKKKRKQPTKKAMSKKRSSIK